MGKGKTLTVLVAVALLAGSAFGWWMRGRLSEAERESTAALRSVEIAGLCANALRASEAGRSDTVQRLLEARMASAVSDAADRVGNASPPGLAIPNLIEGLRRARQYALENRLPDVVIKCDRVMEFLTKSNARA